MLQAVVVGALMVLSISCSESSTARSPSSEQESLSAAVSPDLEQVFEGEAHLHKRSPYSFKKKYLELKRLPSYNFGLGKRYSAYEFGLGKKSLGVEDGQPQDYYEIHENSDDDDDDDEEHSDDNLYDVDEKRGRSYGFGLGKRDPIEKIRRYAKAYDFGLGKRKYEFGLGKRAPMYEFGLGKRAPMYEFGLGKRAPQYEFGLGKRAPHYEFGLGKRAPQYEFGLGKRAPMYEFGLGKRSVPNKKGSYEFGLGKKSAYEFGLGKKSTSGSSDNALLDLGKRISTLRMQYDFGLGRRQRDLNRFNFGLGKRSIPDNYEYEDNDEPEQSY